jgi:hypothetical protein
MDTGQVYLERIAVALERLAAQRQPSNGSGAAIRDHRSADEASLQGLKADVAEIKPQLAKVMELPTAERGEVVREAYTVEEVAKKTKFRPFTIRQACNKRRVAGAYKARHNAWRIPYAALIDIMTNSLPPEPDADG